MRKMHGQTTLLCFTLNKNEPLVSIKSINGLRMADYVQDGQIFAKISDLRGHRIYALLKEMFVEN